MSRPAGTGPWRSVMASMPSGATSAATLATPAGAFGVEVHPPRSAPG
jgi:hypothetical protein